MSHTIFFGLADVMGSIPLGLDGFIFSKGVLLLNFDGDLYVNCSVVSDALHWLRPERAQVLMPSEGLHLWIRG